MLLRRLTFVCLVATATAVTQDWPHWRGPRYDGSSAAKNLPVDFGPDKNVRWAADLPGPGANTPIVVGDRVFLSSVDTARRRLVALCIDRKSGKRVWKRDAGSGYKAGGVGTRTALGHRSNYASPSATTDGKRVVFFFGNGDLVAYDYAGKELWRRNIQEDYGDFSFQWTFSASPTLWEGKLFLHVLQRDIKVSRRRSATDESKPIESFVLAMDPATGETIYRHVRPSPARMESREAYTTMIPRVGKDGHKEILVVGGDVLTGHDPETGKELWRWGTWNPGHRQHWWRLVPTVVLGDGLAVVCAPKRAPVYAIRLGDEPELAWQSQGRPNLVSSDVPTPAFADGFFYVLNDDRAVLSKVAAKDGGIAWSVRLPRDFRWRASPTVADGKVWCLDHSGLVVAVDKAKGEILGQALLGGEDDDRTRSSIVAAHDSLFIRTNDKLYCIGR